MNKIKLFASVASLCLLVAGCASTSKSSQAARRFKEASSANAVLQFSSWEYTFLMQPRYDDHGFLLQVPREKVSQVLDTVKLRKRELAVVVIGWNYKPEQVQQLVGDWKTILGDCGFQRVVVLKSNGTKDLNGSLILDDSKISARFTQSLTGG